MTDIIVHGRTIDQQTRCVHYASPLDVVAIKFACCGEYYPCYRCHAETAGHPAKVWPRSAFAERAVLCGVCRHELTIAEYLAVSTCPHCGAGFNPGCHNHLQHYFDVAPDCEPR